MQPMCDTIVIWFGKQRFGYVHVIRVRKASKVSKDNPLGNQKKFEMLNRINK